MLKLEKTIDIKAPVERVFDYLSEPKNLPAIWPSMVEVSEVRPSSLGGNDFNWVYKMAGLHFRGHSEVKEFEKGRFYVMRNESGIPSTFRWTFSGKGTCTVKMEVEYSIPTPIIGKLAENVLHRLNEREAETVLLNLKSVIESQATKETPVYA